MIVALFLLFPAISFADIIIPHQAKENVEWYSQNYDDIKIELKLDYDYIRQNRVFLFPSNYHGQSEYYDLGFYLDLDLNIKNDYDANVYRILYQNERTFRNKSEIIPEPSSLFILFSLFPFIFLPRKNNNNS